MPKVNKGRITPQNGNVSFSTADAVFVDSKKRVTDIMPNVDPGIPGPRGETGGPGPMGIQGPMGPTGPLADLAILFNGLPVVITDPQPGDVLVFGSQQVTNMAGNQITDGGEF